MDLVGLELNAFLVSAVGEVLRAFVNIVTHPIGPSVGFSLDLEKSVHIGRKQVIGIARKCQISYTCWMTYP